MLAAPEDGRTPPSPPPAISDRLQITRICTNHGTAARPTLGRFPPCQSVQSVSHGSLAVTSLDPRRYLIVDNFESPGGAASLRRAL